MLAYSTRANKHARIRPRLESLEERTLLTSQMLEDFIGGQNQIRTNEYYELNDETYFVWNRLEDVELWKTDGTSSGTERVSGLGSHPDHSPLSVSVQHLNDKLLITLSENLGFSHPVNRPFTKPNHILTGGTESGGPQHLFHALTSQDSQMVVFPHSYEPPERSYVLFSYASSIPDDVGIESVPLMGITDGTYEGTRALATEQFYFDEVAQAGDNLVVSTFTNYYSESELWISDGLNTGGQTINLWGDGSSAPRDFIAVGNSAFFTAETEVGRELWSTDGTVEGTQLVSDIHPGAGSSNPTNMVAFQDTLYFIADDGNGDSLWSVVENGTVAKHTVSSGSPVSLYANDQHLHFAVINEEDVLEFWQTGNFEPLEFESTLVGTTTHYQVDAIDIAFEQFGDHVFATVTDDYRKCRETVVNCNATGKLLAINGDAIVDLGEYAEPLQLHKQFGQETFFSSGGQLWTTDGSLEGTQRKFDDIRYAYAFEQVGSNLLFSATKGQTSTVWIYDGITVSQLKVVPEKTGSIQVHSVTNIAGKALLMVSDASSQQLEACFLCGADFNTYLLSTDGESIEQLSDKQFRWLDFGTAEYSYPEVYYTDGNAYFSDHTLTSFWKTDFTSEGTRAANISELPAINPNFDLSGTSPYLAVNSPMDTSRLGYTTDFFRIGELGNRVFFKVGREIRSSTQDEFRTLNYEDGIKVGDSFVTSLPLAKTSEVFFFASDVGDGEMRLRKANADGTIEAVEVTPELFDWLLSQNSDRVSGKLYFHAFRGTRDEIWSLDTESFERIALPTDVKILEFLTVVDEHVVFLSETEMHGVEIWSSPIASSPTLPIPAFGEFAGHVDFNDFLILSQNFGQEVTNGINDGDMDNDGKVTFRDFLILSQAFG